MSPVDKGRFCQQCQKTVVDYSGMTDRQILAADKNTCGRFMPSQLDRELAVSRKPFLFTAVLTSFLATISPSAKATLLPTVQLPVDTFSNDHKDITGQFITGQVVDQLSPSSVHIARIQLKNTELNTSVDNEGNFKLFIPDAYFKSGFSLVVSSPGYATIEVSPLADTKGGYYQVYAAMHVDQGFCLTGVVGGVMYQTRWQRFKSRLRRLL